MPSAISSGQGQLENADGMPFSVSHSITPPPVSKSPSPNAKAASTGPSRLMAGRSQGEWRPLAPRIAHAIDELLADRTEGFLLHPDGTTRYQAARAVRRLAKAAGINKTISPHSLRHTAVTLALDSGVSLRDVQDLARHADPRTTRRYDRARGALDRHATYELARFLA